MLIATGTSISDLAFAGDCGKFKIRRRIANLQGHIDLPSEQNCNLDW